MYCSKFFLSTFILATSVTNLFAQSAEVGKLSITGAYARETVAGQSIGSAFLKIKNTGAADKLISASSPSGSEVQLHTMTMEGNVMKMSQIASIDIPQSGSIELTPGGMHLMIMGIKSPFKVGESVKIKFKFTNAGEVEVNFPVQSMSPAMGGGHDRMKM
jgi:copper(I)-binding protein